MTDYIDEKKVKQEFLVFLRNSDIIPIATRGVATTTQTTVLSTTLIHTITTAAVRNIRSISVAATGKSIGTDYTVEYGTSSTAPTIITFGTTQTGTLSTQFDHGSKDKIYDDFPRPDLSLSSFPRIGFDIFSIDTEPGGFGNVNVSDLRISVVVYADKKGTVLDYVNAIRAAVIAAAPASYTAK